MNITFALAVTLLVALLSGCAGLQPYSPPETPTREEFQMIDTMREMKHGFTPDGL